MAIFGNKTLQEPGITNAQFAHDVHFGLTKPLKTLPSRYFYDQRGDLLFQQIMRCEAYYPTRCETEILTTQAKEICKALSVNEPFDLVEFGAGDGTKTRLLLRELLRQKRKFRYVPVDISGDVLEQLTSLMKRELPELEIQPLEAEYFQAFERLAADSDAAPSKAVLFLGGNIGNFPGDGDRKFLENLGQLLNSGDRLFMGMDLQKDPDVIRRAYNDPDGFTRAFNLNLLVRMNNELGADFQIDQFEHYPIYDPVSGEARSFVISKKQQTVSFAALNWSVAFEAWEPIFTETSRKYKVSALHQFAGDTGFEQQQQFYDCKHYFTDVLWRKI